MNPNATGRMWLRTKSAAERLDMTVKAFEHFLKAELALPKPRITKHWLHGRLRFKATEIDACVEPEPSAIPESQSKPLRIVGGRHR